MSLHVITPLFRFQYLKETYKSLSEYEDIIWHISKSTKREKIEYDFLINNDKIKFYDVDCLDTDTTSKRNVILENIKDGYFCFVDDDTIFHENMYQKYLDCLNNKFVGMVIGQQLRRDNKTIRLKANEPKFTKIDTGNVLAHHSCLTTCKWPKDFIHGHNQRDSIFWESVFNYYGKKCLFHDRPISIYNYLRG